MKLKKFKMKITTFRDEYYFLSNFSPSIIVVEKIKVPTVEHAYQGKKTNNLSERLTIYNAETPGEAKRLGRKVKMRKNWEGIKFNIMYKLLKKKFTIPELRKKLLDTGDAHLEEENTWGDRVWGTVHGEGENHLGKLLMKIRMEIKNEKRRTHI